MNGDTFSLILNRALDIIFAKYPARTGLGVILGGFLYFTAALFGPALKQLWFIDVGGSPAIGWPCGGILVMHIPTIVSIFRQPSIGNNSIDQALDLIERGNFSPAEKRQHYRNVIERFTSSVALNKEMRQELAEVEGRLLKPSTDQQSN